jgi:hypothetical protein
MRLKTSSCKKQHQLETGVEEDKAVAPTGRQAIIFGDEYRL